MKLDFTKIKTIQVMVNMFGLKGSEDEILDVIPGGMNFDPVKRVKETLSRVGYACEMNFDPLARHLIVSGCSHITCSK